MASTSTVFGDHGNHGVQVASNFGHILSTINISQPAPSSPKVSPSSTVPFQRDTDFVHRDILESITQRCSKPGSRVALVGLGGVGKSQLAIEYSYRLREKSPSNWVFWVHAGSLARFEDDYRKIAERVKPHGWDKSKADIVRLVNNWLSNEIEEFGGHWTMILDNADDIALFFARDGTKSNAECSYSADVAESLSACLPQSSTGCILVTSRNRELALRLTGSQDNIVEVQPMNENHALVLFKRKFGKNLEEEDAAELLHTLDYMPLAITQAAAYIRHRAPRITLSKYLRELRKGGKVKAQLLEKDLGDRCRDHSASNSIILTWQMSFEYIRRHRPSAARLLSLMSFFDRQAIPDYLLRKHDNDDSGLTLGDYGRNEVNLEFEEDVSTLRDYSLIGTNMEGDMFEMHRLVQFSTQIWLELNADLEQWKERYICVMEEAFPSQPEEYRNWPECQILYPHAKIIITYQPTRQEYIPQWAEVLLRTARYATEQGRYEVAVALGQKALEWREKVLGKNHPDTLASIDHLATTLTYQAKYKAAEAMHREALNGREQILGKEHPATLTSLSNLACVLREQHDYEVAEKLHRQVLKAREKILGKHHPDTLESLNLVGRVLYAQGKHQEAESYHCQALEQRQKLLGDDHPNTLISLNNLALMLILRERYDEAEVMLRQGLEGREKAFGKEHPRTLTSLFNLASVLHVQGRTQSAEELYRRAHNGREKILGKNHPETLKCLAILSSVLRDQGEFEAAEEMYRKSVSE